MKFLGQSHHGVGDKISRMAYTTTVSVELLSHALDDPDWAILDCRFSLADTAAGRLSYRAAHIPGAVYVHLDEDLCATVAAGKTGRHPLPPVDQLVENFSRWGIERGVQVVVYDDYPGGSGAMAARCWWSLRYLGHSAVAVLDGGWQQWRAAGLSVKSGTEQRSRRQFVADMQRGLLAGVEEVQTARLDPAWRLLDSRSAERYRGENETIDAVPGHIPGAIPAPFTENLGKDGLFFPSPVLRRRFGKLLGDVPAERAIFYCGSGVTAAHNLVAMAQAGLGIPRLYVGSWSEWITDPDRPIER
jgi:thiosulfate/3-mercaptopyruvate sulfurtransferase